MPIDTKGNLWIFNLNVGQADTSVIITPGGKVLIIDASHPRKLVNLLAALGLDNSEEIEHMVITHPHNDHYSGIPGLLESYYVRFVSIAPYNYFFGRPGYWKVIEKIQSKGIVLYVVGGYAQLSPDGTLIPNSTKNRVLVELLGPSPKMMSNLSRAKKLHPNHLSIIARLTLGKFRMIFAADAQEANWHGFDSQEMAVDSCASVKAAHHGSAMGTDFGRLSTLAPKYVYVSSDPNGTYKLPDQIGCDTFLRLSEKRVAALSYSVGSLKTEVKPSGRYKVWCFGDTKDEEIRLDEPLPLSGETNDTDWELLSQCRREGRNYP